MTNNKSTQRLNSCFKVYCPIPDWSSPGTACCCAHGNLVDALYPDLHHGTHGQGWYIVLESLFISFHSLPAKTDNNCLTGEPKASGSSRENFLLGSYDLAILPFGKAWAHSGSLVVAGPKNSWNQYQIGAMTKPSALFIRCLNTTFFQEAGGISGKKIEDTVDSEIC